MTAWTPFQHLGARAGTSWHSSRSKTPIKICHGGFIITFRPYEYEYCAKKNRYEYADLSHSG